jgi:proline iminopeptidase
MHRAWPDSELVVVGDAGHSSGSMGPALAAAIERFAEPAQLT